MTSRFRSSVYRPTITLLAGSLFGTASAAAQTLTWLGTLDSTYAEGWSVADNGSAVAGWTGYTGLHRAFRWTPQTGMQDLGSFIGSHSEGWGMSGNGEVVVGYSFVTTSRYRAFRWESGVMQDLGTFGGQTSWAYDASFDGSVVVGAAEVSTGYNHAFRWTPTTGLVDLGTLPGAIRSVARACSADGTIVVGWSGYGSGIHHAWRWQGGIMSDIHNPAFGQSEALGMSSNGNVVVGAWGDGSFTPARPFRWSASTGMVDMGTLGGAWGEAYSANADGTIIVGWAERSQGNWGAFRWTEQGGMEDLNTVYSDLLDAGHILRDARGISPDGRFITGRGYNATTGRNEAYLLDTAPTSTCNPDVNCDGSADGFDVEAMEQAVGGDMASYCQADADFNRDGSVDGFDVESVEQVVGGSPCP